MADKNLASKSLHIIKEEGFGELYRRARRYFADYLSRYMTELLRPHHSIKDELLYWMNYHLRSKKEVLREIQGLKMLLDLRDKGIHKDLFLYGYREPECTKIAQKELYEGMKVADIGANIGYYALMEAQIVGNSGKIYAIEPEPRNFERLSRNIDINSYTDRVELLNASVGDKNGEGYLSVSSRANLHKIASPRQIEQKEGNLIKVDMVTLDKFLAAKDISFIRMDVEGYEYFILKGMERILNENKPLKMLIEVHTVGIKHRGGDVDTFLGRLSDANFRLKYLVTETKKSSLSSFMDWFRYRRWPGEETVKYDQLLNILMDNDDIRHFLNSKGGYTLFLER